MRRVVGAQAERVVVIARDRVGHLHRPAGAVYELVGERRSHHEFAGWRGQRQPALLVDGQSRDTLDGDVDGPDVTAGHQVEQLLDAIEQPLELGLQSYSGSGILNPR